MCVCIERKSGAGETGREEKESKIVYASEEQREPYESGTCVRAQTHLSDVDYYVSKPQKERRVPAV